MKIHNNVHIICTKSYLTFGAINLQFLTQSLKQSVTAFASDGLNNRLLPAKVAAVDMKKDRRDVDDTSSLSMMLLVFNCNEDTDDDCCRF